MIRRELENIVRDETIQLLERYANDNSVSLVEFYDLFEVVEILEKMTINAIRNDYPDV